MQRCTEFEKERLRDIFLRLTRLNADVGSDGRDTRRRVLLRDLIPADSDPESTKLLIKQLADARLVVVSGVGQETCAEHSTLSTGLPTSATAIEVEVAHEALIRHWERLRAWLNDDRDNLRLREGVSDEARRWDNADRDESLLNHRGARLELALEMRENSRYRLNPVEQAYLDGCLGLRVREIKAKETLRRRIMVGLATGLAIALVLAGFAAYQMEEAQKQTQIAIARQLAAQAQPLFINGESRQQTAVLLAIQSMRMLPALETAKILQNTTLANPISSMTHKSSVSSVAFSPDGKYVVSGSWDKTARVWETGTGKEIARITLDGGVSSVAFSPDSKYVVSGSDDNTARVWEVATGKEISRMTHNSGVTSVTFSPDGKYVISGSWDGAIRIWSTVSGHEIAHMKHNYSVHAVAI
ncbi:MAG: hypothetical protein NT121_06410, partial [Chloroflexi bacterium]|nr:hypothetical protein [Chloroflexota bacterium]